jgi:hypothetical protein
MLPGEPVRQPYSYSFPIAPINCSKTPALHNLVNAFQKEVKTTFHELFFDYHWLGNARPHTTGPAELVPGPARPGQRPRDWWIRVGGPHLHANGGGPRQQVPPPTHLPRQQQECLFQNNYKPKLDIRARICRPLKEPRNRFPAWRALRQPYLSCRPARIRIG